jgi:hypothetical protein
MTQLELGQTNVWLAIIAISSVAQLAIVLTVAILAWRAYGRVAVAADELERDHLRPLALKANALMDDLQDVAARVRTVDDAVRARMEDMGSAIHSTRAVIAGRFWPLLGAARALRAGVNAWNHRGAVSRRNV